MDKFEAANREKLLASSKTLGEVVMNDKTELQGKKVDNTASVQHKAGLQPEHKEVPAGNTKISADGKTVEQTEHPEKVEDTVKRTEEGLPAPEKELENEEIPNTEEPTLEADEFEDEGPKGKDTPEWAKKRFGKLTAQREEAKRKADELEAKAQYWENEAKRQQGQAQPTDQPVTEQKKDPNAEPRPEDFDTYEKYIDARVDFRAKQLDKTNSENKAAIKRNEEFGNKATAFAKEKPDYDVKIQTLAPIATPVMVEAAKSIQYGPQVAYYLANHHDKAREIASLHPVDQILAIKELNDKFKPQPKKSSKANEPLKKVEGEAAGESKKPEEMTFEEYRESRKEALAWKRPQRTR